MTASSLYSEAKQRQRRGDPLEPRHRQALSEYQAKYNQRRVSLVLPSEADLESWRRLHKESAYPSFSAWVVEMVRRGQGGINRETLRELEARIEKAERRAEEERDLSEELRQQVKTLNGIIERMTIEVVSRRPEAPRDA